jgi:hypothetical protein
MSELTLAPLGERYEGLRPRKRVLAAVERGTVRHLNIPPLAFMTPPLRSTPPLAFLTPPLPTLSPIGERAFMECI